jgi:hypothetical protein
MYANQIFNRARGAVVLSALRRFVDETALQRDIFFPPNPAHVIP